MNINSKIKAQKTYIYQDTLFKSLGNVSGVDIIQKETTSPDAAKFAIRNMFNSECALIRFYGTIPSQSTVYRERLSWGRGGVIEETIDDTVALYPTDEKIDIDFHLRFFEAGEYDLYIEFYGINSQVWSKKLTVSVVDDYRNALEMYKIVPLNDDEFLFWEDVYNILNIKGMSFQLSDPKSRRKLNKTIPYYEHSIFISNNRKYGDGVDYGDAISTTHTLIIPLDPSNFKPGSIPELNLPMSRSYQLTESDIQQFINDYDADKSICPDYWVYMVERPVIDRLWVGPQIPQATKMLVCIRKIFGNVGAITITNEDNIKSHVNEYRFYPIFHKLIPFDNSQPITSDDIIYIKPSIHHSKPITISHWEFRNDTTQKIFMSDLLELVDYKDGKRMGYTPKKHIGGQSSTIFAPQEPRLMDPGYYSVILHYKEGGENQTFSINSAFLLEK